MKNEISLAIIHFIVMHNDDGVTHLTNISFMKSFCFYKNHCRVQAYHSHTHNFLDIESFFLFYFQNY